VVPVSVPLRDGRVTVPGNRWDLLDGLPATERPVSVVVPYYDQQADLDRLLAALDLQTYPHDLLDVVIADDGSPVPPVVRSSLAHRVVRQEDQGFRAAAARNLGAAAGEGEVLCFLDADMVPEPDFVRHLVRLPLLSPDGFVVGRRRHADLDGWTAADVQGWLTGGHAPRMFEEPAWLREAYARTRDLLDADARSYKYVISALMCCTRELFEALGGFDEVFVGYGGEDWEFAHRAFCGGAVLQHNREAVAWHNGPDWAGRDVDGRADQKNREALRLAALIPDPDARTHGLRYATPQLVVRVHAADHSAASLVTVLGPFLGRDAGVWVEGPRADDLLAAVGADDARLHAGPVPDGVLQRCHHVVTLTGRPLLTSAALDRLLATGTRPGVGRVVAAGGDVVCEASWARNRSCRLRAAGLLDEPGPLADTVVLDATALPVTTVDLDHDLSW
jgi:GT2 family glycosyltransferase